MTFSKLSEIIPVRPAGALPSSRTEILLTMALESDDIDVVKAHIMHVWAHYQSLEFALNAVTANTDSLRLALADPDLEHDIDDVALAVGFFAEEVVLSAYEAAHSTGLLVNLGFTVPEALRELYPELDHSDPGANIDDIENVG